jgi:hypothetical protein
MEPYSYMKPNNTVKIQVVNQCRRSVLASRKNIVNTLRARLTSLLPVRLAELPAHDAKVNVPLNHTDEWHAELEELVEGNLFLMKKPVAPRKNEPLCFERVCLPGQRRRLNLIPNSIKRLYQPA